MPISTVFCYTIHYTEWFEEQKTPEGVTASDEELKELKEMPIIAMVASVGSSVFATN